MTKPVNMETHIRILIADDHSLVRRGLIALLGGHQIIQIVGEAADGFEAINLTEITKPDVILMDLEMPRLDGIIAIKKIKGENPNCKILVVSNYYDDDRVIAALKAGANGYLLKTTMPKDLLAAIIEVYQGGAPLDPAIMHVVLRHLTGNISMDENVETDELTERELTVLKLLAKGYSDQRIATTLSISVRTVSTHVHSILRKLSLENRTQAALYALRNDLAELDHE
ncbi:MAG: response regulator [Candidatus Promineifilaceae bacterium]|jgi:NarL family two-component system response regulator LiaR